MPTAPSSSTEINFFEIAVSDLDRAAALYEAMLATTLKRETFMGVSNALFSGERGVIGALIVDPKRPAVGGKGTVIYLQASDGVPAALARALRAGAKLVLGATDIGEPGTIALVEDFDGNVVGLHAEKR